MQTWREESIFSEYLSQQAALSFHPFNLDASIHISAESRRDHITTFQQIQATLQRLQPYLPSHDHEFKWVEQLNGYIQRLSASSTPQSPEEQFSQLYALRKWLFWVPVTLLSARKGDIWTLLVLAHFYAAALSLEPAFPSIGAPFLSNLAMQPLEEIVRIINTVSTSPNYSYQTASLMMDYPRDTLNNYRAAKEWNAAQGQHTPDRMHTTPQYGLESLNVDLGNHFAEYGYGQSLSPAFAPSPLAPSPLLHASPPSMLSSAGPRSPYLEVPRSAVDSYSYSSAYSTPLASPAGPPHTPTYALKQEGGSSAAASTMYGYALPPYGYNSGMNVGMGTSGGLVAPLTQATVWT